VREVIAPFIYQAIAGEITPEEALDQAAAATDGSWRVSATAASHKGKH
jgi:hypothetical protein